MRHPSDAPATTRRDWGPWRLDMDEPPALVHSLTGYEITLDTCQTSALVLDWICQIAGKTWAGDDTIAGLVHALDELLEPQANLCSRGQSKQLSTQELNTLVRRWER